MITEVTGPGGLAGRVALVTGAAGGLGSVTAATLAHSGAAEEIHPDLEAYERFVLDHQAVKRRGRPQDVAAAVLFFAGEDSGFITGQLIAVDGGWVMP